MSKKIALVLFCGSISLQSADTVLASEHVELSDANSKIAFQVDTTWHLVHGKTTGLKGFVDFDPAGKSVSGSMVVPVGKFDTEDSDRDERMREVMDEPHFNDVVIDYSAFDGNCLLPTTQEACVGKLHSEVTIRGKKLPFDLPVTVKREKAGYLATGKTVLQWRAFGVEDPSIIVARLYEDVTVEFEISLPDLQQTAGNK